MQTSSTIRRTTADGRALLEGRGGHRLRQPLSCVPAVTPTSRGPRTSAAEVSASSRAFSPGAWITDTVTALKLFPAGDQGPRADTSGFELDHEITAKLLARGYRIVEVPVTYYPRSKEEGQEDRTARLVHRHADVLSVPQRLTALTVPR